jgi:hypothetical protein
MDINTGIKRTLGVIIPSDALFLTLIIRSVDGDKAEVTSKDFLQTYYAFETFLTAASSPSPETLTEIPTLSIFYYRESSVIV